MSIAWKRYIVVLPQFNVSCSSDLTPIVEGCGITDMFNKNISTMPGVFDEANFCLNFVKQNCEISVDENGTEIKVSTGGELCPTDNVPPKNTVYIDKPFAFEIGVEETGAVILQGRVNNLK